MSLTGAAQSVSNAANATGDVARGGMQFAQNGRGLIDRLCNYIVKPKGTAGIGGFVFDFESDSSVTLQSEITDHYVENNTAIQDHVARKPVRITLHGYVGELTAKPGNGLNGLLSLVQGKMSTIPAYLGKYTPGAVQKMQSAVTQAQNFVNKVDSYMSKAKNIVGMLPGAAPQLTKQQQAYSLLSSMWANNQIMLVETPWAVMDSMVIENLTMTQPEETKSYSDVSVTLKEIRYAAVKTTTVDRNELIAFYKRCQEVDKGQTQGKVVSNSILKDVKDGKIIKWR